MRRISIQMRDVYKNGEAGELIDEFVVCTISNLSTAHLILQLAARMVSTSPRIVALLREDADNA